MKLDYTLPNIILPRLGRDSSIESFDKSSLDSGRNVN
jgi:hypothetical protein